MYVMLCNAYILLFEGGLLYCHISIRRPLHLPDPRAHPAWICQRYQIHVHPQGTLPIPGAALLLWLLLLIVDHQYIFISAVS